jgi:hypothetical protein
MTRSVACGRLFRVGFRPRVFGPRATVLAVDDRQRTSAEAFTNRGGRIWMSPEEGEILSYDKDDGPSAPARGEP